MGKQIDTANAAFAIMAATKLTRFTFFILISLATFTLSWARMLGGMHAWS